ncbi:class A sortase [Leuconostoc citreum]
MINLTQTVTAKIPRNEQLMVGLVLAFFVLFILMFLLNLFIAKLRKQSIHYKKIGYVVFLWSLILCLFGIGIKTIYQSNLWSLQTSILKPIQSYERQKTDHAADQDKTSRAEIAKMVMRQANSGLDKQGFVSIPERNILLPIYNDAYSDKGLNAGANYANRSADDPEGKNTPVMGKGNYGLAAHNFNDGTTGFSGLQQETNHDLPYLQNDKLKGSNWLNGKTVLLANAKGIYDYQITGQTLVTPDAVSVLNSNQSAEVTIISCLFPSTDYRIITHAKLRKTYTWGSAPQKLVKEFNLKVKNTNAHVAWWNPGVEEGANGDKGGAT